MTDRELNLKMAEVCGIPVITFHDFQTVIGRPLSEEPYPQIWVVSPHLLIFVGKYGGNLQTKWNPVHDFNQLFEHVVPALDSAGLVWDIGSYRSDMPYAVAISDLTNARIGSERAAYELSSLCRRFCEIALKAWQQLKETS